MLEWTGERYLPYIDPLVCGVEIHYEHLHRYAFASDYVKGKIVLDLASGEGYGSFILAKNAKGVVGVDIDPDAIEHARTVHSRENLEFLLGSITEIPIEGEHLFDVIVCFEAIEHIEEQDALLSEVKRLLKHDGIFIVSTPNKSLYTDTLANINPFHKKELEYPEFENLLNKNFSNVQIYGQSTLNGSRIYPIEVRKTSLSKEYLVQHDEQSFSLKDEYSKQENQKYSLYYIAVATSGDAGNVGEINSYLIDQSNTEIAYLSDKISKNNQISQEFHQQIAALSSQCDLLNTTVLAKEEENLRLASEIKLLNNEIYQIKHTFQYMKAENDLLKNSISYRFLTTFQKRIINTFLPYNTKRRDIYDLGLNGGRIACNQGLRKALSEYKKHRASKKFSLQNRKNSEIQFVSQQSKKVPEVYISEPKICKPKGLPETPLSYIFNERCLKSQDYLPLSSIPVELKKDDIKYIAFYLPQFHPIPENDMSWGKGFTEWYNVTKALPQFIGHYQPHRPDELGYYDLRLPEIQKRQVELAKHYGIFGFCYYYYWFNGKKVLERPLEQYIQNGELDLPFCICWANENWTRRWDGLDSEILLSQVHTPESDVKFIHDIEPLLRDSRYIRIDGKPLLMIYRAALLPEPKETVKRWRDYCRECGIGEIYLAAAVCFGCSDPTEYGFDAGFEFPPHTMYNCNNITGEKQIINPKFSGNIFDYKEFVYSKKYLYQTDFNLFRTVSPGWDNTARRPEKATIYEGASPCFYREWLRDVSKITKESHSGDEQIVFINAWNEWAEGAHLEPDQKFGYGYLQATSDVLTEMRSYVSGTDKKKIIVVSHDAHLHGAQMLALHLVKALTEQFHYEVHVLLKSGGRLEEDFKKYAAVYNIEETCSGKKSVEELVKKLRNKDISLAICNTIVSGDIVEILSQNGIRTVSLIHELPGVIHQMRQEKNAKKISQYADSVVYPSEYVKELFLGVQPVDEAKCKVAPQGLFLKNRFRDNKQEARKLLRQQFSLPEDSKIVLNIGYADYRKGPDIFIEVAKRVLKDQKDVYFIWVGLKDENFMSPVDAEIKKAGIGNNVIFPGICRDNIDIYYSGADVFLLTSREDPFPSVVLDAMNAGIPVIGFDDAGGFKDVISGDTGRLVPHCDVDRMTDSLLQLLGDASLCEKLGENAAKIIDTKFSFTDYVYKLLGFLGEQYKKVSVVLPNYNYERYLPQRLESITNQTYPVYEIIILDDCSTDKSTEIIKNFVKNCPVNVKVSLNPTNSGSAFHQWAKGIALSAGDYIWIAEADDLSDPEFLATAMKGFSDEDVVLSYTQSFQMDENGKIIADNYLEYTKEVDEIKWNMPYFRSGTDEICDSLAIKNTIPNVSAVVFRKTDISCILDTLIKLKVAGDWYFYTWLLEKGWISYNPEVLNYHRRHSNSITKMKNPEEHFDEIVFMQDFIISHFEISEEVMSKVHNYRNSVKNYLLGD